MLYLITSIPPDGSPTASIHDCVDEDYAAQAYGLEDADVYVCELATLTAFRKARTSSLTRIDSER